VLLIARTTEMSLSSALGRAALGRAVFDPLNTKMRSSHQPSRSIGEKTVVLQLRPPLTVQGDDQGTVERTAFGLHEHKGSCLVRPLAL
jgi:hypothetical protein